MTDRIYQVLFVCSHNSARSIMAEGILNSLGGGRFMAHSAGSHPAAEPHPMALKTLAALHIDASGYRSKDWQEFAQPTSRLDSCRWAVGRSPLWLSR